MNLAMVVVSDKTTKYLCKFLQITELKKKKDLV